MKFTKRTTINASADKVWTVFAHDFDNAHKWMASVPHSYAKANGEKFDGAQSAGRVCDLDGNPSGMKASEKFLAYDEANRTCSIRIDFVNTPGMFPVDHNAVDFSVVDAGDGQSEMTWAFRSKIKPWAFLLWPIIRLGFGVFVGQIIEELTFYLENDTPHPRKVKASGKAKLLASA
jgi:hypothetical protein